MPGQAFIIVGSGNAHYFGQSHVCSLQYMQNLPVLSDALSLHCLPFLTPDVRIWVQDVAGVGLAAGSFFAGLVGSLCFGPGDVS